MLLRRQLYKNVVKLADKGKACVIDDG